MTVNRVIKILIYSDVSIITAFALFGPIFAIFIAEQIKGGGPAVAGLAAAVYWAVRSIIQLPISTYLDKHNGEKDDFWAMVAGSVLVSVVPLFYLWAQLPWHIYVIHALYGVGDSLAVPTYLAIYGRHVDKAKEGSEWALRSVFVGVGSAIAGAIGGFLAEKISFQFVFVLTSILSFVGSLILFGLKNYMQARPAGHPITKIRPPVKARGIH